ncbi:helix-turn-helix transcriptional regulator [Moorena sp. SIO4G3]|uniref:helix-turn-helix domain-containing protein n=1 Tax=Moorena sp. SIO4G3 TaxID=2607821 RepID=UPI00142BC192|nr:helix-turn-helix transcriptional regulator [Moorena sp. SIO4G3]NEO79099.1 helix-turn-helix transcriptional regulator [Moorena sp. SIO4G3]
MIKNQRQYDYSQELVRQFESDLSVYDAQDEDIKKNDCWWKIKRDSLQSHLNALKAEVAEYETLINHDVRTPIVLKLDDINNLPQLIIKARLAANISQKQLADIAGLTEEKIIEYEDKDYQTASLLEFLFVLDALDIKLQKGEFLVPIDTLRITPITAG